MSIVQSNIPRRLPVRVGTYTIHKMANKTTISIGRHCANPNVWTTDSELGTVWHGFFNYVIRGLAERVNADLKFVHQIPNNTQGNPAISSKNSMHVACRLSYILSVFLLYCRCESRVCRFGPGLLWSKLFQISKSGLFSSSCWGWNPYHWCQGEL